MKNFISLILLVSVFSCSSNDPLKKLLELKPMPSFSLLLPDSSTWVNTSSIKAGKPVVLFFFSPHCPYCRAQMKDMVKNMGSLKNIEFYMVSNFPVTDIKQFYSDYQLADYTNIIVGRDTTDLIGKYYKLPGVPFTAVYSKDKQPRKFFFGVTQIKDIQQAALN